jgi:hypothetical protein
LTKNTATTCNNNWGIDKYKPSHSYPSDNSKLIETAAVVFYANGSLTERGTNVTSNFFYYMGVSGVTFFYPWC